MGKRTRIAATSRLHILLILQNLHNFSHWPLRCNTNRGRLAMIRQLFFMHYQLAYKALAALFTIGAAVFLAYLVLQVRW
jgi:hypothetical protein